MSQGNLLDQFKALERKRETYPLSLDDSIKWGREQKEITNEAVSRVQTAIEELRSILERYEDFCRRHSGGGSDGNFYSDVRPVIQQLVEDTTHVQVDINQLTIDIENKLNA